MNLNVIVKNAKEALELTKKSIEGKLNSDKITAQTQFENILTKITEIAMNHQYHCNYSHLMGNNTDANKITLDMLRESGFILNGSTISWAEQKEVTR